MRVQTYKNQKKSKIYRVKLYIIKYNIRTMHDKSERYSEIRHDTRFLEFRPADKLDTKLSQSIA